jgi:hypothetical protein
MLSAITPVRGCSKGAVMTIQETNVVTPLPPKTKSRDNTAALRQRRSRTKSKPSVTPQAGKPVQISGLANEIKADVTVAPARRHATLMSRRRQREHSSPGPSGHSLSRRSDSWR